MIKKLLELRTFFDWAVTAFVLVLPMVFGFVSWWVCMPETFWQRMFILLFCVLLQVVFLVGGIVLYMKGKDEG